MFTLNCKGRLLVVDKPLVMGIINVTPDSFYKESRAGDLPAVLRMAEKMLNDGADILDIGGQSTRPGSGAISPEEEMHRVIPVVKAIHEKYPETIISIDTYFSKVAAAAVDAGASLVNDISAGSLDAGMISTVAELRVPYVLMHMQGTPSTMQQNPAYTDVTREVLDFFIKKLDELKQRGVTDVILDPGFGFGKTMMHNFELLRNLTLFQMLDRPLLVGLSRKSTISRILDVSTEETLNGTTVLNTIGLMNGASILRVHDVKEAKEAVKLFSAYKK